MVPEMKLLQVYNDSIRDQNSLQREIDNSLAPFRETTTQILVRLEKDDDELVCQLLNRIDVSIAQVFTDTPSLDTENLTKLTISRIRANVRRLQYQIQQNKPDIKDCCAISIDRKTMDFSLNGAILKGVTKDQHLLLLLLVEGGMVTVEKYLEQSGKSYFSYDALKNLVKRTRRDFPSLRNIIATAHGKGFYLSEHMSKDLSFGKLRYDDGEFYLENEKLDIRLSIHSQVLLLLMEKTTGEYTLKQIQKRMGYFRMLDHHEPDSSINHIEKLILILKKKHPGLNKMIEYNGHRKTVKLVEPEQ
jgi:hypothetical protein